MTDDPLAPFRDVPTVSFVPEHTVINAVQTVPSDMVALGLGVLFLLGALFFMVQGWRYQVWLRQRGVGAVERAVYAIPPNGSSNFLCTPPQLRIAAPICGAGALARREAWRPPAI